MHKDISNKLQFGMKIIQLIFKEFALLKLTTIFEISICLSDLKEAIAHFLIDLQPVELSLMYLSLLLSLYSFTLKLIKISDFTNFFEQCTWRLTL